MSTKRVMEDLDALLADLQSTTSHISNYQQQSPGGDTRYHTSPGDRQYQTSVVTTATSNHDDRDESPPPPLPPPPSQDVLDSLQLNNNQVTTTVKCKKLNDPTGTRFQTAPQGKSPGSSPVNQSPHSSIGYSPRSSSTPGKPMSSLSSNLSELDSLLQDLSSPQFMAEVDRRNASNVSAVTPLKTPPPVSPKPAVGKERTVDSLLNELENFVPPPRQQYSTETNHYETVNIQRQGSPGYEPAPGNPGYEPAPGNPNQAQLRAVHGAPHGPQTATRELDDLMASLSEFKVSEGTPQKPPQPTHIGDPPYAQPMKYRKASKSDTAPPPPPKPVTTGLPASSGASHGAGHYDTTNSATHGAGHYDTAANMNMYEPAYDTAGQPSSHVYDTSEGSRNIYDTADGVRQQQQGKNGQYNDGSAPFPVTNQSQNSTAPFPVTSSQSEQGPSPFPVPANHVSTTAQVHQSQAPSHGSQGNMGQGNNLEAMLGNLNTDLNKQGITTVPKGHCAACAKPIVGQVITALGKIWHPEHFTCVHCKEELGTMNFFERDSMPYCERDYHNLFSPGCSYCQGPILDKCVTALGGTWHPEHFFCAECGRPFGDEGFHEKDGKAFCRDDYFEKFAPKCGGCSKPIMDHYISALNRQWHAECFICTECRMPFGASSFFDHEGMPYCETHYHARRGSLCAGCHKPITGRCITAMYKKFHPEHFVCAFCLKQLNKGTFKEQNEKPYCHPCFVKLFG